MCLWYLHIHTVSLVAGPYRLIDGDSRVGNPIHRAEDKFHVPQCVSKWATRRVAVLVRLRLHRETTASADLCTRVYMCTGWGIPSPPTLVSNCVHWDSWVQEIPCNSNSLNSYVVRLFLTAVPRNVHLVLPSTCLFSVFYVNRVSILSRMQPASQSSTVSFDPGYNGCVCIRIIAVVLLVSVRIALPLLN